MSILLYIVTILWNDFVISTFTFLFSLHTLINSFYVFCRDISFDILFLLVENVDESYELHAREKYENREIYTPSLSLQTRRVSEK
jgi:hypothetical protein